MPSRLPFLESTLLASLPKVRHGFFTRNGGISKGIYTSLNAGPGSDDCPQAIKENRARIANTLEATSPSITTLYQIHSETALRVSTSFDETPPKADALVTTQPGLAIAVLTADCAPVLLADPEANVIAAAHAGWRGALGGVLESTLSEMEKAGARRTRIIAAIGPCIGPDSYEVDRNYRDNFLTIRLSYTVFFRATGKPGFFLFDLPAFIQHRLTEADISHTEIIEHNTYAEPEHFFSYRRSCHRNEPDYGRQASVIMLQP